MDSRDRDILERAVRSVAEQAANTNKVIDEAMEAGLAADHPVTVAAKQVRLELLNVKADLERELGKLVLSPLRSPRRSRQLPPSHATSSLGRRRRKVAADP